MTPATGLPALTSEEMLAYFGLFGLCVCLNAVQAESRVGCEQLGIVVPCRWSDPIEYNSLRFEAPFGPPSKLYKSMTSGFGYLHHQ